MASDLWSSSRLTYRGLDPEDDDLLTALNANPQAFLNVAQLLPTPRSKKTTTQFREHIEKYVITAVICLAAPTSNADSPAAEENESKPVRIGIVTLKGGDPIMAHHRNGEIGIHLLGEHQGKGYGTEAIKWILKWAFMHANLHRVGIGAFGWNPNAVRLYEKIGFVHEGRLRDILWHNGKYWDSIEMSMLESEWRALYGEQNQ